MTFLDMCEENIVFNYWLSGLVLIGIMSWITYRIANPVVEFMSMEQPMAAIAFTAVVALFMLACLAAFASKWRRPK